MICKLKEILKERGIKHNFVAESVGVSETTLSSYMSDRKPRLPTLPVAYKIARLLELKIEDIWYIEE